MSCFPVRPLWPMSLELSVIVPVKNEMESIPDLACEIETAMGTMDSTWECLWVDDGSTDRTLAVLENLHKRDSHHHYISLSQNFGQSAAFATGFIHSRGKLLITMDGDGQNDPADIPHLTGKLHETGCDMVQGWRKTREDSLVRKISSRIGNGYRNKLTRDSIRDVGCSLRVMKRQCVENLIAFKGMHRFLPTLVRINGFENIIEMPVNHRPRLKGQTKYGIGNRMFVGIKDTFAVRWMAEQLTRPTIRATSIVNYRKGE